MLHLLVYCFAYSSSFNTTVKENAVPDNTQYNTSVLNNGKEASKKIPKIPLIRSYLYGNMGNSSVLPMNSLAEMIIKPLLSLDKRNEIDNSTDMMTPNIVLNRTFEASNERMVTSPSGTEDSAAKEASKKIPKIPVIRSYLHANMGNSSVPPMNSLAEIIIKPLLSLEKRNEIDNSTEMMTPNIVRKRTFKASNDERIVTSPSATEDSAAKCLFIALLILRLLTQLQVKEL
ncbi:Ethylmalonyl-CoA decarboxylase [Trichinella spiralis]|uniref:Ethylmalonyl-CoA decarboxylase n=1 Tax=Trichinella spiralis TaxID=6334 RepID=A0ABR3KS98_TRISP